MLKVLHIVPTYLPAYRYGGPIYSVHELNKWLVKNGADVTVYTTNIGIKTSDVQKLGKSMSGTSDVYNIDGVKIHYFKSSFPRSWFYSKSLRKHLRNNLRKFDLVHITSVFLSASCLGAKYAKKSALPYIISPRGSLIADLISKKNTFIKKFYINLIEKRNLAGAAALHFTTELEKEEYLKLGLPLSKSIVIPNGVEIYLALNNAESNAELRRNFKKKFKIPESAKIILSLGRLNWKKGFDTLIPSFAEVLGHEPNVVLVIAGGDDENYKKEIELKIKNSKLKINSEIIFTGDLHGEEKLAAFRASDIFVMPSYSENFGISAVEAMTYGVSVIVTDTVGIARDIREAKAGVIIKKDVGELAKAIIGLLRDKELRKALGERGKKLVAEKYSWPEIAHRWISEYEKILTKN